MEELLAVLRDARPAVPDFAFALDELGFTRISNGAQVGPIALEVMLSDRGYRDAPEFRGKLSMLEGRVCQVRAAGTGTGVLIAPDLVLTNRHVIAGLLAADGRALLGDVTCVFDWKSGGARFATPETRVVVRSVEASSPHADGDLVAGPMVDSASHLDYAILRLAERIGDKPITVGGEPRGVVEVAPSGSGLKTHDAALILQHPMGQPMMIDIGAVLEQGPTRLRHNVNTASGSSGAPLFDATLRLAALHHAGHENGPPSHGVTGFNQAIPIEPILDDARREGVMI
ncbi:hypothetical protein GCM10010983_35690 [Caulobacter rhizosphaerae]|nr:hypothetical protein GCM10010983_35690 [Caulobacter rhizosphaerae]